MNSKHCKREDHVSGLIMFRFHIMTQELQCLLLKKRNVDDWSPPKGKREERGGSMETEIQTAVRETEEETGLIEQDYQLLNSCKIAFQYTTSKNVTKKVTLWPALLPYGKDIRLSREHDEYAWLPMDAAEKCVKSEYRCSLIKAGLAVLLEDCVQKGILSRINRGETQSQ